MNDVEEQQKKGEKQQDALLKSLDPSIWTEGCKPLGLLWQTLPRYYTDETLVKEHHRYQSALDIVELRLSRKVMSSYNQFVTAMNDVQSLTDDLQKSVSMCRSSKEAMTAARGLLAVNGMTIVALYKRRQKQYQAIVLMVKLRKFLKTRQEMNDRSKVGDFGTAFRLCMQIRDLYKDLAGLQCMQKIALALKDDVDDLRAKVDRALGTMSRTNFNPETYKSILEAMIMMHGGKTMKIFDAHTTHFKASVDAATKRAIITTLLSEAEMFSPEELERLKIVTLCRRLTEHHFPLCLNLMFEQFCNYLFTYHAMTAWLADSLSSPSPDLDDRSLRIYRELRDGLLKHKRVLWEQQMQENITHMLGALKINEIGVQTFLSILASLSKFISIVEEFGGTMAHTLRETFRAHAKVFFAQFHKSRLEQLKDLVEKESWDALADVKKGYGIKNFPELQQIVLTTMPQQRAYKRRKQSFFEGSSVQSNPFAAETDGMDMDELELGKKKKKQIARYKWEEAAITPDLLVDTVDELGNLPNAQAPGRKPTSPLSPNVPRNPQRRMSNAGGKGGSSSSNPVLSGAPLVADVARQLVIFVGEYMHLMQLLPHMTHTVFDGLVQVMEYFIWTIHSFFATSKPVLSNGDRDLAIVIRRIQSDLLLDTTTYDAFMAAQAAQAALQSQGIGSTMLSGIKDTFSLSKDSTPSKDAVPAMPPGTLSPGGTYYRSDPTSSPTQVKVVRPRIPTFIGTGALQQQVSMAAVAASSLKFLRQILMELQPNFIELLGRDRLAKVLAFAGTLAETTVPLRNAIFRYMPQGVISLEKLITSVAGGQWDSLNEDISESSYVRPLIKEVVGFIDKLKAMVRTSQLPAEMLPEMVVQILSLVMEICVEGYSKARRVTSEGHNIMLFDSQEIKGGMEKASGIKQHDWSFVDEYVHAYHFPVDDLLTFFREHPWYTKSQLSGLVVSGPWNQKEKTKLLDALNFHGAFTASASSSQATSSRTSRSSSRR